jgi:outer membrane protein assembly factor BamB
MGQPQAEKPVGRHRRPTRRTGRGLALRINGILGSVVGLAVVAAALVHPAQTSYAYPVEPLPLQWRPDGRVEALAAYGDTLYVGQVAGGITAVNVTTGQMMWTTPADSGVLSLTVSADGSQVMAGGNFLTVDGEPRRRLVALDAADGSVVPGWSPSATGKVLAMAVHGSTLYVGGSFGNVNGSGRGLAALDVATGQRIGAFAHSVEEFAAVQDMTIGAGRLLASGDFTTVDGRPHESIAAFELTTHDLLDWAPARLCSGCANYWSVTTDGVNAYVGSSGPGGKLGAFDLTTGEQPWRPVQTDGDVQAVSMGSDGYVYIGGHFQHRAGGAEPRTQLASVEAATGDVGPFNPVMCPPHYKGVLALVATATRLYVGGTHRGVQVNGSCNDDDFLSIFAEPAPPPTTTVPTTTVPTTTVPTTTVPTTTVPTTTVPTTTVPTTTVPTTTTPTTTVPTTTAPSTTTPTTTAPSTTTPTTTAPSTTTPTTPPAPVISVTAAVSTNLVEWPRGVRVSGRVTEDGSSLRGASVTLWASRAGAAPRRIATITSSPAGTVAYTHHPTVETTYQWRMSGVESTSPVVRVRPSVTAHVSRHHVAVGAKTSISGITTPSRVATPVTLQKWNGQRWVSLQSTAARHTATVTGATRAFHFDVSPRSSGAFRYRAVVPADDGRLRAVSPERRVWVYDAAITRVRTGADERVVVRNTGPVSINLEGWSLSDRGGTRAVLPQQLVPPGKVLRIHSGRGRSDANDLYLRGPDRYGDNHDRVVLRDRFGFRVSSYRY